MSDSYLIYSSTLFILSSQSITTSRNDNIINTSPGRADAVTYVECVLGVINQRL